MTPPFPISTIQLIQNHVMEFFSKEAAEWLDRAAKYPVLPMCEMIRLGHIIQSTTSSDDAKARAIKKIVRHNLKLIPKVVRRVLSSKKQRYYGDQLTVDLFQSGAIGLQRAAELFDPTRGYAFSTYAQMWIFQAVKRESFAHISLVKIPEHVLQEYYKYHHGDKTELNEKEIQSQRERFLCVYNAVSCFSLDRRINDDTEENLNDWLAYQSNNYSDNDVCDDFDALLNIAGLSEESLIVLRSFYKDGISLTEIGKRLNLSRSRVTKIQQKSLKQIRSAIDC